MDIGSADEHDAQARIWFDFALDPSLLERHLNDPHSSPSPAALMRHLCTPLFAARSSEAAQRVVCGLVARLMAATSYSVRLIERDLAVDADRQAQLLQLVVARQQEAAVVDEGVVRLAHRWLLRNRLAAPDADAVAAKTALLAWLSGPGGASGVLDSVRAEVVCDVAVWLVLVDRDHAAAAALVERLSSTTTLGDAAIDARVACVRALCLALVGADAVAREAIVAAERARIAGDAAELARLLAADNCAVGGGLGVAYRRALVEDLRAAPPVSHGAAASVAADALVVLDAARGVVASGHCSAGVQAQCEAALQLGAGGALVRERIAALLERGRLGERLAASEAAGAEPLAALGTPMDPVLRLLLGGGGTGVATAAIQCGADASFLARGAAQRWGTPDGAQWLNEVAAVSPALAMQQWMHSGGGGGGVAAPPFVSLECGALERVIAVCADRGEFDVLRRVCEAQQPSDGAAVQFGLGVATLFPLIASAVASGAMSELDDGAWRAMTAFVDSLVRSKATRGGSATAFSAHRLVEEHVREPTTLARLYGLIRGALASCVQQTAFAAVSVEAVAEPLAAALRNDDAKWGAAVVVQPRKRSIHASLDAERRLCLLAHTVAARCARRVAHAPDVAVRWRVAAGDACARVPVPEVALYHYAGAVASATAQFTASEPAFVDALGGVLGSEALERLAVVLAHGRNFCAAACVCQFVPQGARLAYNLLTAPWRANDWKRAYLATLFDVTIGELLAKRCFVRGWQATGDDIVRLLAAPERNEHNDAANRARVRDACCRRLFALLHRDYCARVGSEPPALADELDDDAAATAAAAAAAAAAAVAAAAAAARLSDGDEQGDEQIQIEQ